MRPVKLDSAEELLVGFLRATAFRHNIPVKLMRYRQVVTKLHLHIRKVLYFKRFRDEHIKEVWVNEINKFE
jgi:hypothetical protein